MSNKGNPELDSDNQSAPTVPASLQTTEMTMPSDFLCPITNQVMRDPVMDHEGNSYERAAILQWLQSGHITSPITRNGLAACHLVPNRALKNIIESFLSSQANSSLGEATATAPPPSATYSPAPAPAASSQVAQPEDPPAPVSDPTHAHVLHTGRGSENRHSEETPGSRCFSLCCGEVAQMLWVSFGGMALLTFHTAMLTLVFIIDFLHDPSYDSYYSSSTTCTFSPVQEGGTVALVGAILYTVSFFGMGMVVVPVAMLFIWIFGGDEAIQKYIYDKKPHLFAICSIIMWLGLLLLWAPAIDRRNDNSHTIVSQYDSQTNSLSYQLVPNGCTFTFMWYTCLVHWLLMTIAGLVVVVRWLLCGVDET